jgi:hypothetical protein
VHRQVNPSIQQGFLQFLDKYPHPGHPVKLSLDIAIAFSYYFAKADFKAGIYLSNLGHY